MTDISGDQEEKVPLSFSLALFLGALAVAFEAYGTLTAMPVAAKSLGRYDLYAWSFTAFVITQVLATVLAGRTADRIGPVKPLTVGLVIFAIGLLGAGLSTSMAMLLSFRALQGFGGGVLGLAMMVLVAQVYGKAQRAWIMSIFSFCWMLPSFLGPPIAAWITTRWSWHWAFLAILPLVLCVVVMGWRPVTTIQQSWKSHSQPTNQVPVWAAFVIAIGTALIQYAGQQRDQLSLIIAVIGIVLMGIALPRLMTPGFLRFRKGLSSVMWTRALAGGTYFAAESFVPVMLSELYDFSVLGAGFFLALGSTGWALGSFIQAWHRLRLRRDQIVWAGAWSMTVSTAAMAITTWNDLPWQIVAAAFVLLGMGMGLTVSSTSLINMQVSEVKQLGRNTSSLQVGEGIGNAIATGLSGTIFAALLNTAANQLTFGAIYTLCLLTSILSAVAAYRIGPVRNESSGVG